MEVIDLMEVNLLELWTNFLPIANIVFAVVFVVVIYSTAAGQGLSNYSVKKILPRLIIVAIGVNISYYICAFIVDIVNIAAVGIPNLIFSGALEATSNTASAYSQFQGVLAGILGVVLIFSFGMLALVAVLVTVIALVARQVVLSALVVISPIAIVCAVLPATQKWFDKWLKTFVQLLAVYPLFMIIWAAVRWFQTIGAETMMAGRPVIRFIVETVCTIIPAVAIYPLLKASGGVMGQITGALEKSPLGTQGALGKAAQDRDALRRQRVSSGTHAVNRLAGIGGAARREMVRNPDGSWEEREMTDEDGNTVYRRGLTNFAAGRRARRGMLRQEAELAEGARSQTYENTHGRLNVRLNEAELRKDIAGATKEGIKEGTREGQLRNQAGRLTAEQARARLLQGQRAQNYAEDIQNDASLRRRASAGRAEWQNRVLASAQQTIDAAEAEDIKAAEVLANNRLVERSRTAGLPGSTFQNNEVELSNMLRDALSAGNVIDATAIGNLMQKKLGGGPGVSNFNKQMDNAARTGGTAAQTAITVARSIDGTGAVIERDITRGMASNLGISHVEFMNRVHSTDPNVNSTVRGMLAGWADGIKADDILALNKDGIKNVLPALSPEQLREAVALNEKRGGGRSNVLDQINAELASIAAGNQRTSFDQPPTPPTP